MLREKGFVLIEKYFTKDQTFFLKKMFIDKVHELYGKDKLKNFEDLVSCDIRTLDLIKLNKRIIYSKEFFNFINSSSIIELIKDFIDNNSEYELHPALNIRIQPPNEIKTDVKFSKYLSWHQDIYTMDIESKETPIFTLWIPLTDSRIESGGIDIIEIPNNYKDILEYDINTYMTIDQEIEKHITNIKKIVCESGSVVIFDKYLLHKTRINYSLKNRISLDIRIFKKGMNSGRKGVSTFTIKEYPEDSIYNKWIDENNYFLKI